MPDRPIKMRRLTASWPRAILRVEKTWPQPCVVLGSSPTTPIEVTAPGSVVVPLYKGMGGASREKAAVTLTRAAESAGVVADVFVVEVRTPTGVQGYGMVAVPRALEPRFLLEQG